MYLGDLSSFFLVSSNIINFKIIFYILSIIKYYGCYVLFCLTDLFKSKTKKNSPVKGHGISPFDVLAVLTFFYGVNLLH